jgi:hypothetical protein
MPVPMRRAVRHPAVTLHQARRESAVGRVAQQGVAPLQPGNLVQHVQRPNQRGRRTVLRREEVLEHQVVRMPPRLVVVKPQPIACPPTVKRRSEPPNFRGRNDLRKPPQPNPPKPPVGHLDHSVPPPPEHLGPIENVADGFDICHEPARILTAPVRITQRVILSGAKDLARGWARFFALLRMTYSMTKKNCRTPQSSSPNPQKFYINPGKDLCPPDLGVYFS